MNLFPSKSQWKKWSLPSKASYLGFWVGGIGILIGIIFFLFQLKPSERPMISILSIDTYLTEDSMRTKFAIKNVGGKTAFVLIRGEASIDGNPVHIKNEKSSIQYQVIMPDQTIRYRGLTIEGNVLK